MREFCLESYDYKLPLELIAKYPVEPKENAKLLVFNRQECSMTHTTFAHLFDFIDKDFTLVFNDTKVIKARIYGKKASGAKIEFLLHKKLEDGFLAQTRGRIKVGDRVFFKEHFSAKILDFLEDGYKKVAFFENDKKLFEVFAMLEKIGHIPLPPYLKRQDEALDKEAYQSVFAKNDGAIAAPTASLHFSDSMRDFALKNYKNAFLTLHIGAGTFASVESQDIRLHNMHTETLLVSKTEAQKIKSSKKILCVGTTAMRSVEFLARNGFGAYHGDCNIFLHLGNLPIKTSALLTNFHLPKSSLIMLVSSMVGLDTCLALYQEAIKQQYRFYSYGDGMLIL